MAYSDDTEFPKGLYYNDLTADRDVALAETGATTTVMKVAWILIANDDAAAQTVLITDTNDANKIVVTVPADSTAPIVPGFSCTGLKLAMAVNDSDVHATVVYFK